MNKYAYANGNPVSLTDPLGTSADNWSTEDTGLTAANLMNKYVFSRLAESIAGGKDNVLYSSLRVAGLRSEALLLGFGNMIMNPINAVRDNPASIEDMLNPYNIGAGIVNTISTLFDPKQANNWWSNSDASLESLINYGGAYSSTVATVASAGVGVGESIEASGVAAATDTSYVESSTSLTTYWPHNDGFLGKASPKTFQTDEMFDRYGYSGGKFGAPVGTPAEMRALEPGTLSKPYNVYEVLQPFDGLEGQAKPWFGQSGLGTQYKFGSSIQDLIDQGYIRKVN